MLALGHSNLTSSGGNLLGGAGGAITEASADAVPHLALALVCAGTLAAVMVQPRRRASVVPR